jgi:hypothetical protein
MSDTFHFIEYQKQRENMNYMDKVIYKKYYENIVEKISNSSSDLLLQAIVIGIITTTILVKANLQINSFMSILIAFVLSYLWLEMGSIKKIDSDNNNNSDIEKLNGKLNGKFLNNLNFANQSNSVLYMNPALVKVFTSMYPFARFDVRNYKEALISTNELIRVYESAKIGHTLPNQTIDIAESLQRNILNHMQSIIHSFPTTVIADYRFEVDINILQKILQKIINDIKLIYEVYYEENGPSIYNPPPSIRSGPWENPLNEKEYNKHWNFYY